MEGTHKACLPYVVPMVEGKPGSRTKNFALYVRCGEMCILVECLA